MEKKNLSTRIELYIIFLTILGQIAIDLYLPSMHGMMKSLGMSQVMVQWTVSAYLFGYGFSQLLYGPVSDVIGRRKIIIFGMFLSLCGSIGCTVAWFPGMILIFRILQGLGSGAASVIARAIMRDSFTGNRLSKASSHMAMAWSLVPILAPVLGGVIERQGGWRCNFGFLMLFSLIFLLFILFTFPETHEVTNQKLDLKKACTDYGSLFANYKFSLNMIVLIVLFSIFSIFNVSSPFILQEVYNLSVTEYSIVLCIISFGYLLGSFFNGKLLGKFKSYNLTLIGIVLVSAPSIIMVLLLKSDVEIFIAEIIIAMMIIFIGLGLIFSNSLSECLQPFPDKAGTASAMYGFLVFVGGSIISALYSKYLDVSALSLFVALMIIGIIMLISYLILYKMRNTRD